MKKILSVFAAGLLVASFFGCANDSDNNNSALLLAVSQKSGTSVSSGLPANEGENKLSGNTYKLGTMTYKFAANTFDAISVSEMPNGYSLNDTTYTYSEKATVTTTTTYNYAYANNTIYFMNPSIKYEYKNGDKTYTQTSTTVKLSSDADYVKNAVKNMYNEDLYTALGWTKKPTDAQKASFETTVKSNRYSVFGRFGYTDTTSAAEVSAAVLEKYNNAMVKQAEIASKVIGMNAYKFDASNNLQLASVGNYPKTITLAGLYYGVYPFSQTLTAGNITISGETALDTENVLCNVQSRPAILLSGSTSGFKIKAISDNAATLTPVVRSGSGTVADPYKWTVGSDVAVTFTPSKTDSQISYELKVGSATLGTVTIPFTSTTSTTTYTTFTKQ